jgi:hypothetical protein
MSRYDAPEYPRAERLATELLAMPALLAEDTPERPTNAKGRLRAAFEGEMRARAEAGRFRAVVLRAGDFYGSGEGSWLDLAIAKDLAKGRLVYPGPQNLPHAWAYLPDLARAFVAVAERSVQDGAPAFETLHFAGHTLTGGQLLDLREAAAADIGAAPAGGFHRGGMPWGVIRLLGVFIPNLRAIAPSNVEYTEVQPDGGKFCFHMKLKPGVPLVYNRSLINTAYQTQVDDTHYFITSSEGNESLVETYADQIGSDVIASLTINAIIMKPKLDSCGELCGTELIQVYSMNPNGSLPSMVTDKLMAK